MLPLFPEKSGSFYVVLVVRVGMETQIPAPTGELVAIPNVWVLAELNDPKAEFYTVDNSHIVCHSNG